MKILTTFKVGATEYKLEVDESKDMEALHKSIVLSNPPRFCNAPGSNENGYCGNTQFFEMDTNKDKDGNIYVNVKCKKCFAKAKLGQYKAGGYFWHQFKKFERSEEAPGPEEQ